MRRRGVLPALLATIALVGALAPSASACQACFGAEESPMIDGAKLGAAALVVVTLAVQGGFAAFFIQLGRRAKAASREELDAEWAEIQKSKERT